MDFFLLALSVFRSKVPWEIARSTDKQESRVSGAKLIFNTTFRFIA